MLNYNFIFENISDLIILTDRYGFIIEINSPIETILGYRKEELLKKNLGSITCPNYKNTLFENISKVYSEKEYTYENIFLTKDGKKLPFELKSKLIDTDNKPLILTIGRNISERKKFEEKLLETIVITEERERKRIASELHDNLSPILSTIKLYVDLLQSNSCEKQNTYELLQTIKELINSAIQTAKEISFNITPTILEDFGLAFAIEEFVSYINKTKSVNIQLNLEKYKPINNKIYESILFYSVKELINNTLKHANAKKINIQLKNDDSQIMLYYKDDGVGFDINEKLLNSTGLGIKNILNKVRSIGGKCDFYSLPDEGMVFIIIIKL